MALKYKTFGPFDIERDSGRLAESALENFWAARGRDSQSGLDGAIGVYVIVVQAKKNSSAKPWYVGRTDRQSFKKRLTQQQLHFRQVLEKAKRGKLQIYLLALQTPGKSAFRKPTKTKISSNDWLESLLIGSCLNCNKHLVNASKVRHLKTLVVPGFLNNKKGKLDYAAASLKRTLQAD